MRFWNFETAECETMAAKFHWKLERDEAGIIRWVRDNGEVMGNYFEIEYALLAMWRWLALEPASKSGMMAEYRDKNDFNPTMLTLAREVRGLSMQTLGEQTGLTWGRVSKLEAGLYPPTDDEIAVLSQALDFPPAFFYREGRRYPVFLCERS